MNPADPDVFFFTDPSTSSMSGISSPAPGIFTPPILPARPASPPLPEIVQVPPRPPSPLRRPQPYRIYRDIAALSIASSTLFAHLPRHRIARLSKRAGNWRDDAFVRGVVEFVIEEESERVQHVLLLNPSEQTGIPTLELELVMKVEGWERGMIDLDAWEERAERYRW